MSYHNAIITFKAGRCEINQDSKPYKVTPLPDKGYIYLYFEDDLIHFCWRGRTTPIETPEVDLVMIPTDGSFVPYGEIPGQPTSKTNGRIFVLKFSSSPQRHLFWLQSKPQSSNGDPSWVSPRDERIGEIVNQLLRGEVVGPDRPPTPSRHNNNGRGEDDDEPMEDATGSTQRPDNNPGGSGGAGAGATGGDVREEGEESREGGADGARAASLSAPDAATAAVRGLLDSLKGSSGLGTGSGQDAAEKPWPYLTHLLPASITVPVVDAAPEEYIDRLLGLVPPTIIVLATGNNPGNSELPTSVVDAAKASLSLEERKKLIKTVVRSPQFHQALTSLTLAIRDGGLPSVADALKVPVENGGYLKGGAVPLGGGMAVEAFVEGFKKAAKEKP